MEGSIAQLVLVGPGWALWAVDGVGPRVGGPAIGLVLVGWLYCAGV